MNPPPPGDPAMSADELRRLRQFLAEHDLQCPGCGYSLRGLETPRCPECGLGIRFPTADAVADEASESARLALWLRDHDLICKKCKTNLRGGTSNVCPKCGATYMLQHTSSVYVDPRALPKRREKTSAALLIVLIPLGLLLLCLGSGVIVMVVEGVVKMFKG